MAWLALAPGVLNAQQYAPADPQLWWPLGSTRPEDGGFYVGAGAGIYRTNNPLKAQTVARRGFQITDNSVAINPVAGTAGSSGFVGTVPPGLASAGNIVFPPNVAAIPPGGFLDGRTVRDGNGNVILYGFTVPAGLLGGATFNPGTFLGSQAEALNVAQLTGADSYQPSLDITLGWKFKDGSSLSLNWFYITDWQYRAGATLAPPNGRVGLELADTFLIAPVFNFPPEYAGADFKIRQQTPTALFNNLPLPQPNPQAVFGIWNGASIMTLEFIQRFQRWEVTYREPIFETETYRMNGLVGPRFTWIWEKFKWTTTSIGEDPLGNPQSDAADVAIYTNIVSNRMYGAHAGCQQEFYMGHGFACMLTLEGALYVDTVKERAKYELADKFAGWPENKRAKHIWTVVPELDASAGIMWYPTEFVQLYLEYNFIGMLNTIAGRRPIDFNYSQLDPHWSHVGRMFDGLKLSFALTF